MKKICLFLAAMLLMFTLAGCTGSVEGEATVQSVSMICGTGNVGFVDRFAGLVSPRSETVLQKEEGKVIGEILVEEGDDVTAGQLLFTYDSEAAALELEKACLELEQMKNTVAAKENEKAKLEEEKAKAKESELLQYSLAIQEADTAIREFNYNIALKEKEIQKLEESMYNLEVFSPVDGRIKELNENEGYDNYGQPLPFMSVMETGDYRVKGLVNEANVGTIMEGMPVLVRSRLDSSVVWYGSVILIDWENPQQGSDDMYYYGAQDEMTSSSKYPFYVELEDASGLLLGQHVYIEPDYGQEETEESEALWLPAYFLVMDGESDPWVWAQNGKGKLEKRTVVLGEYDAMMDSYEILEGLTEEDYLAYPEETLQEGMTCVTFDEQAFETEEGLEMGMYEAEVLG